MCYRFGCTRQLPQSRVDDLCTRSFLTSFFFSGFRACLVSLLSVEIFWDILVAGWHGFVKNLAFGVPTERLKHDSMVLMIILLTLL